MLDIYPYGVFPTYFAVHNATLQAQMIIDTATKKQPRSTFIDHTKKIPNLMQKLDDDLEAILLSNAN